MDDEYFGAEVYLLGFLTFIFMAILAAEISKNFLTLQLNLFLIGYGMDIGILYGVFCVLTLLTDDGWFPLYLKYLLELIQKILLF